MANYEKMYHIMFNAAQDAQRVAKLFIIRCPAVRRGSFTCCLRRGTFVTSDKSTQKRRLKLRFKTSSARCALCQTCLMPLAQSPFPCAAVGQKDCAATAFRYRCAAAACCHGSSFPLYRRDGERAINGILAAQRAAPTPAAASAGAGARFDNRRPTGREFPKGEGAHALSLWTL